MRDSFRWCLIIYLSVVLVMSFLERWLVYPAPPTDRSDWSPSESNEPSAPQDVWIESIDGVRVHGWFYEQPDAQHAVLYCHGNAEQVADNHVLMQRIRAELNASVLIFDFRGYGKTYNEKGERPTPNERTVVADGLAAQRWLAERTGRLAEQVVLIGRSLGGGVATAIAAEAGSGGLLLQDTFTRLTDAAWHQYPWLPVHWIMVNRFDSIRRISAYEGPLLISHGQRDRVVPFAHAQRLLDASPSSNKLFLRQPERGHHDSLPNTYWATARRVLNNEGEQR